MIPVPPYFQYLPAAPEICSWGLGIVGAGCADIAAGQDYPPPRHPNDHAFTWKTGRVLESMQLLVISRGAGWLECGPDRRHRLTQDSAFVLLPGVWHRYRPDPDQGWHESWCEMRGPVVDQLTRDGVLSEAFPVRQGALASGLEETLAAVHRHLRDRRLPGFDPVLSSLGLRALALWAGMNRPVSRGDHALEAVARAERYLAEHVAEPVDLQDLARRHGLAYSHFRRLFRSATGYSPWQYVIRLRLELARRRLSSGDAKLREIAENLGFSSAFHFSSAFRSAYGTSPSEWRRRLRPPAAAGTQPET